MLANATMFTSTPMANATPAVAIDVKISVTRYIKKLYASGSSPARIKIH